MPKCHQAYRLSTLIVVLVLLAACGGDPAATTPPAASAPPASTGSGQSSAPTALAVEPATPEEAETAADPIRSDDEESAGGEFGEGSADTSGEYVADIGFRPDADGFSFPNYGDSGEVNLTADEVRRLFGDQVCTAVEGESCVLSPVAEQWMQVQNASMGGGHCEGMAVLSKLFYTGYASPNDFGAASVPELEIEGNEPLQREIAYWFITQATFPAREGIVEQTPSGVVNTLMTSLAAGQEGGETYAIGIYKRDRTGGHAVTPYAVEDRGDGIYWIMVYDNNYPGAARAIEVDTNADTWRYSGSTNPDEPADEYEGDAETFTLELAPIQPRLGQQICPFCDEADLGAEGDEEVRGQVKGQAPGAQTAYNEIWLDGDADLLITDMEGRSIGFRDGAFVNEIPGAISNANKFGVNVWDTNAEPVYYIPTDIDFTISIDGSRLDEPAESTVTMLGPGYALEVSDIVLDPGQVDTLDVAPDGSLLSYRTYSPETPVMLVAIETEESDYLFAVQGYELAEGEAVNLSLDTTEGWLSLDSIDNTESGSYDLIVAKYDDQGEQLFGAEEIVLDPDDVVYVDYLKWPGNNQPMEMDVDLGGDGTVDEVLEVGDVTDEFAE
jgi:hypothetical protein